MTISKTFYALVAGAGAGTGRSVALRFAKAYPVVVLARNPSSYSAIVSEIQQQGGEAVGVSADTSDAASVKAAMESIKGKLGGRGLAAAICEFFLFWYPLTFFLSWGGIYVVGVGGGG
jgi:NAD(P)-dependent dehydrogenase (short-subunit alcohol dehydrogenase family)